MCLRVEAGARIADETVFETMRKMGLRCGVCRETDRRRYSWYKGGRR